MPPMNPTGTNTAARMSAIAMTGPETSSIAFSVASFGAMPCSMWCITASTTTIASSTTMPMASTRPSSDSTLIEKPSSGKNMNAPTSETGTVSSGISVARQFCRKTNTTMITRTTASNERVEDLVDAFGDRQRRVERDLVLHVAAGSASSGPPSSLLISSATWRALVPGIWKTAMTADGLPLWRPTRVVQLRAELEPRDVLQAAPREPSGLARTMMSPNSSSLSRRPCVRTV